MKRLGFKKTLIKLIERILKRVKYPLIEGYEDLRDYFFNKKGLEIGGPSYFFDNHGCIPVYKEIKSLDGINFSSSTIWTGDILEKDFYVKSKKVGSLYIMDATKIKGIKSESYDFILSCNNIEHIANPLRAIENWINLLKSGGVLVLVVPKKESNFDHNRNIVKFEHLLEDYKKNMGEDDLTHLTEILKLHDYELDPIAGTRVEFKQRAIKNFENRCLHHHVYNDKVLKKMFNYFNLKIIKVAEIDSDYIIIGKREEDFS